MNSDGLGSRNPVFGFWICRGGNFSSLIAKFLPAYVLVFYSTVCQKCCKTLKYHHICQKNLGKKLKKSPVQLAFNPFFGWFRVPKKLHFCDTLSNTGCFYSSICHIFWACILPIPVKVLDMFNRERSKQILEWPLQNSWQDLHRPPCFGFPTKNGLEYKQKFDIPSK